MSHTPGLLLCPVCKATDDAPARVVRVEVSPGSKHFGGGSYDGKKIVNIPCPHCRPEGYAAYVKAFGQPLGMPWPEATS